MLNITLLVYVGHLAVAVTLRAPALPLLPLTSPPAALRPAMTVGAPGTEAPARRITMIMSTVCVTSLTWFCHHRSSGSPGTDCTGYTSQGRSDIGGTWNKHLLGLTFFLASSLIKNRKERYLTKLTDTRARTLWDFVWSP